MDDLSLDKPKKENSRNLKINAVSSVQMLLSYAHFCRRKN